MPLGFHQRSSRSFFPSKTMSKPFLQVLCMWGPFLPIRGQNRELYASSSKFPWVPTSFMRFYSLYKFFPLTYYEQLQIQGTRKNLDYLALKHILTLAIQLWHAKNSTPTPFSFVNFQKILTMFLEFTRTTSIIRILYQEYDTIWHSYHT